MVHRDQAYSIVDPEEIPHMLDLHLFLGRKPVNVYTPPGRDGSGTTVVDGGDEGGGGEDKSQAIVGYDVSEISPDLVHYGNFPQQVGLSRSNV